MGSPLLLCTGLPEAVAGDSVVLLICFAISLVWLGSHTSAGELIIRTASGTLKARALVLRSIALENSRPNTAGFHLLQNRILTSLGLLPGSALLLRRTESSQS